MSVIKNIYRVIRSICVATLIAVAALYLLIYVLFSIPYVQDETKKIAELEVSKLLHTKLTVGSLQLSPFNEVVLNDVNIPTPEGEQCVNIKKVGAGFNLWTYLRKQRIDITYLQLYGLKGEIIQNKKGAPLNIQFLIDAFKPKNKSSKSNLNLLIRNVVIRDSEVCYDLHWKPWNINNIFDPSHIRISNLNIDLEISEISNKVINVNLRRLAFVESSGFTLTKGSLDFIKIDNSLAFKNIQFALPNSTLNISDIELPISAFKSLKEYFSVHNLSGAVSSSRLTLSDLGAFYGKLHKIRKSVKVNCKFNGTLNKLFLDYINVATLDNSSECAISKLVLSPLNLINKDISASNILVKLNSDDIHEIKSLFHGISENVSNKITAAGNINVRGSAKMNIGERFANFIGDINTGYGKLQSDAFVEWKNPKSIELIGKAETDGFKLGNLLSANKLGTIAFKADCNLSFGAGLPQGSSKIEVSKVEFNNYYLSNIIINLENKNDKVEGHIEIDDKLIRANVEGSSIVSGEPTSLKVSADISHLYPSILGISDNGINLVCGAKIEAELEGTNPDNLLGTIDLNNLFITKNGNTLSLDNVLVSAYNDKQGRNIALRNKYINADLSGAFTVAGLNNLVQKIGSTVAPSYFKESILWVASEDTANCRIEILPDEPFTKFFNLPLHPGAPIEFSAFLDANSGTSEIKLNAPYIIQGSNKLIKNSTVSLQASVLGGFSGVIKSKIPMKDDLVDITLITTGLKDRMTLVSDWHFTQHPDIYGNIDISSYISHNPYSNKFEMIGYIMPSKFHLNGADWNISRSTVSYANNALNINNLKLWHENQFLKINGRASNNASDILHISLASMDLSYIFDTLNINFVDFGGIATGEIRASNVFSKLPLLRTDLLYVKNFSYNKGVVGNAMLKSYWDNAEQMVSITADITNKKQQRSLIKGGIYVTKDSLSFDFDANHLNIKLLKPFLSSFSSDVGGEASGKVKLYGTFRDINLTGRAFADSFFMRVGFTNVEYNCSDSIYFTKDRIIVPKLTVRDTYGHTGKFEGQLKHNNFRDVSFDFKLSEAKNLLCFDTNRKKNTNFYGKVFASGSGTLQGRPDYVGLMLDLTPAPSSEFTFALNEVKTAAEYSFLTFNDKSKLVETEEVTEEFKLESKIKEEAQSKYSEPSSLFKLDLRCSLTPDIKINLLMDRKTGDGISARGSGPMTIMYNSDSNDVNMYGKYTLSEGNYKFSLQDIILRDFKINPGSNITFNGDPMQGVLDIVASYRVNANLSEIDQSFSSDKDLSRTSVPVDALLNVSGVITGPEISFDIALPTLTQDVERKVRSIISTDDMMNRQIIYLLALNKFYTPEYMGNVGTGNSDLASVASSTLSGQLSSFLGQITDKLSVAPSFRTDRGDFSDMEVDVALSSRLLNNRLLINGNFGYRDRSTSQTTFIGDFDIEYLLNRNGNFRLKAYNHFNDQYYYLRSAKTTQGLGVVFRRDFDNISNFVNSQKDKLNKLLRKKEDGMVNKKNEKKDTVVVGGYYYDDF